MGIDVAGIACRFPGAADTGEFWDLLIRGRHGIRMVPETRWSADEFTADGELAPGKTNTRHAGFIDDPERFDFGFFNIAPNEAAASDIQQRLVLQTTYHALEDAGLDPYRLRGSATGMFVGVMSSDWATLHLADYTGITPQCGIGNGYCMIANRVSYSLDFVGPSMSVDTACSSSLTAVHLAVSALRNEECDLAVVAGVNLMLTPALSIFYAQAGLSAKDGRCRPFSKSGGGIGRGEGVGVVILRRSADRPADAPAPYASVRGSFACQDGRSNGITAPSRRGQEIAITSALRRAGCDSSDLHFVEAHGTGTTLGDMIEVQALGAVFRDRGHQPPLVIGSVKGNIGHAEGAAGIAGFIKACLSIHHRRVPPSLASEDENPALSLADRGLKLALTPEKLPLGTAVGGVSSFGLGGSNVHVVVGSVPRQRSPMRPDRMGGIGVLTVSGNDAAAVDRNLDVLVQNFSGREQWPRYCYSTNQVKAGGSLRIALVARGRDDLQSKALIAKRLLAQHDRNSSRSRHPRIGFLYTGQGSQYPTMAMALRDDHPGFASALEDADKLLFPFFGGSVVQAIDRGEDHQGRSLDNTAVAQPALFTVQYALTQTFAAHGVRPEIVLGHSVGEIAACVAAGMISPGDAAALVVRRGALMSSIPAGGAMLAAQIPTDDAMKFIGGPVSLAAINGRANVVFSGPTDQINDIEDRLNTSGVRTRRLPVSYAFHSPAMTPIADELAAVAPKPKTGTGVKMISTVDGTVISPDMLVGEYWRKQLLCAVDFYAAAKRLEAEAPTHLIEIGPQAILLGLLKTTDVAMNSVRAAPIPGKAATGLDLAGVLAQLWQSGMEINWPAMYMESDRAVCRLPSYAFADNERFFTSAATTAYSRFVQDIDAVTHSSSNDARGHAAPVSKQSEVALESVHHTIIRVLAEITGHQEDALHPTVDLRDDLGFDSVQAMQFADRIAAELAIPHLDPGALQASLATVADLTNLVTGAASR